MSDDMNRVHQRIDQEIRDRGELAREVASLASSARHTADAVKELADSVNMVLHHTPCQTAQDHERRLKQIEEANRQTIEVTREKRRDWRQVGFVILGYMATLAIAAVIGYIAAKHNVQIPTP